MEVNVNTATAAELHKALHKVGPKLAAKIVEYRAENGPFATLDDMARVSGISLKMVDKFRAVATTSEVTRWLASFDMGKYAHAIVVENGCDTMESVLEDLDEDALEGMGVVPFHRKRILRKIAALRKQQAIHPQPASPLSRASSAERGRDLLRAALADERTECIVCFCDEPRSAGVACSGGEGHFVCGECLVRHVAAWTGPPGGVDDDFPGLRLLAENGGHVRCAGAEDGEACKETYTDRDLACHLADDAFAQYMAAKGKIQETRIAADLEADHQRRIHDEVARIEVLSESKRRLRAIKRHIVDCILTLACPRCGQAFVDFNGCFALTCSRAGCGCGFCAYCLADNGQAAGSGDANHRHVAVGACCAENTGGYYPPNPRPTFERAQTARRTRMLRAYLATINDDALRTRAVEAVARELRDLGLDPRTFGGGSGGAGRRGQEEQDARLARDLAEQWRHEEAAEAVRAGGGVPPLPRVGAIVWCQIWTGKWRAGYEVAAVHTGDRTMDLKKPKLLPVCRSEPGMRVCVARDDVLIDAEAADKRAEIAAYVVAHDLALRLGATLGPMFANDEDEGANIMDPRTCTWLNLSGKDLSAAGAMPPAAAWQRLPEVKAVDLSWATLPATGLENVLAGCAHLTKLSLTCAKFDQCDGGFSAVVDQIAAAPIGTAHPLELTLRGMPELREGDAFSRLIAGCPRLMYLDVGYCDLETLPEELGTACRELEALHAWENKLVGALPASLCSLRKLRVLDLWGNAGLTVLPPAIAQLAQLSLNLGECTGLVAPPYSVVEDEYQVLEDGSVYGRLDHFAAVRDWFAQQQHDDGGGGGDDD